MEEEENYSLQTEPTWEHKALFGTDSILCARCKSILREAPEKGAYHQRRDSSKNRPFYLLFPSFRPSRKYKVRISSHTRDENHNISGFSLMVMGGKILSGQIAAEPLMSSPERNASGWRPKTKSDLSRFNSFTNLSSG